MRVFGATSAPDLGQLRDGDLLFQAEEATAFSDAILAATARDSLTFSHVGIFARINGAPSVIEAVPRHGVTVTPLDSFLASSTVVRAMRLAVPGDSALATRAVKEALRLLGKPYDRRFAPGDSAVYCSELVQIACDRAARQLFGDAAEPVFASAPMNFLASDGTMPQFWVDLFAAEGCPIPQGVPGTNPNAMAASPRLRTIFLIVNPKPSDSGHE